MSDQQAPIESAVHALSDAATLPELIEAHRTLRKTIRDARRKQSAQFGPLATAYREMITLSDQLKADGVSFEDRQRGIEAVIRQTWPFTREWKYRCDRCNDTGLIIRLCHDGDRCSGIATRADSAFQEPGKFRRLCTLNTTYEHDYGVACPWCPLGARFRDQPKREGGDFSDAGRGSNKPTRAGRRS